MKQIEYKQITEAMPKPHRNLRQLLSVVPVFLKKKMIVNGYYYIAKLN